MNSASPKHQESVKNGEKDEKVEDAASNENTATDEPAQNPITSAILENVGNLGEEAITPDIEGLGSAEQILEKLEIPLDQEIDWSNELPLEGATQVQEQVATYNICTDGINTEYVENRSTKLIMSSEDVALQNMRLMFNNASHHDIASAKERLEQLKTEHIDEGLTLDEDIEGRDEMKSDEACTTNVEQRVAVYNLCSDGVNTEYSESKSTRLIKSSEQNEGKVKERLEQLKTDQCDAEGLSLGDDMDGGAERQHKALTNVKQKVTMYNICSSDGVNTKYSQSSKKVSRNIDGKVNMYHQVQTVRKERRDRIAGAACADRVEEASFPENLAGAHGGDECENMLWNVRSTLLGAVKEPDVSLERRREPVEDDSSTRTSPPPSNSPPPPPQSPQPQPENTPLKSITKEEADQKDRTHSTDKELIKKEDAEYARLNGMEYSEVSEEEPKTSVKEKERRSVDYERSRDSVLLLEARVLKLEEEARQSQQSHRDDMNSLRSQVDMLTYYCRNQNKEIEEGMKTIVARVENLEEKMEKYLRKDVAVNAKKNQGGEGVRNVHTEDVRRKRADAKFGEVQKLQPITRNVMDDNKGKMNTKPGKSDHQY